MHLAARRYGNAFAAFVSAALASPQYLLQRLKDELFPSGFIANGMPPELFYKRKEAFWP
jgi:hypothetical protein